MNLETGEDWLAEMALPEGFRQDARSLLYCKDEEETFSILQGDSSTYVGDDGERIYIARSKRKETLGNVTLYVDYKDYEVESSFMNGVEMRIFGDEDTELYRAEFYLDSLYYYVQGSDISEETYLNVLRCLCGEDR
jgi:hypothetical protein